MSKRPTLADVLAEVRELRSLLLQKGGTVTPVPDTVPASATALIQSGEPLTVEAFATATNRSKDWVYDQITLAKHTAGQSGVRVLRGGKPYQIPASEVLRYFAPQQN